MVVDPPLKKSDWMADLAIARGFSERITGFCTIISSFIFLLLYSSILCLERYRGLQVSLLIRGGWRSPAIAEECVHIEIALQDLRAFNQRY